MHFKAHDHLPHVCLPSYEACQRHRGRTPPQRRPTQPRQPVCCVRLLWTSPWHNALSKRCPHCTRNWLRIARPVCSFHTSVIKMAAIPARAALSLACAVVGLLVFGEVTMRGFTGVLFTYHPVLMTLGGAVCLPAGLAALVFKSHATTIHDRYGRLVRSSRHGWTLTTLLLSAGRNT